MNQPEAAPLALTPEHAAACGLAGVAADGVGLRDLLRRLARLAPAHDSAQAWARLAAQVGVLERSSYADYLAARIHALLQPQRTLGRGQLEGVRRVLEAVLEDVLHDPHRRGEAPPSAEVFNDWWDCVVGLIRLEVQRAPVARLAGARSPEHAHAAGVQAQELSTWLDRLQGVARMPALRRAQLLAELLAAYGEAVERPADEADLLALHQAWATRRGLHFSAVAAHAALRDAGVSMLLHLLAPQRCCVLPMGATTPAVGAPVRLDHAACWVMLARISGGALQLEAPRTEALESPGGRTLLRVSLHINGQPFVFDYFDHLAVADDPLIEHLNQVAQRLQLPGCFVVDRSGSSGEVDVLYLPLPVAAALQLSGVFDA